MAVLEILGITSRLNYFVELGIGALWINPFFKSPMRDFGYDIANFTDIDPDFGTLHDLKELVSQAHKRGLKIVIDFVPNHTSEEHDWFIKSVQRIEPFTDFYVWQNSSGTDKTGRPIPPTNWVSVDGGSVWAWHAQRRQFYLHQFLTSQPDLNFYNDLVQEALLNILKFWMDLDVDGFRVDAVAHLYESQKLEDEPKMPPGKKNPVWFPHSEAELLPNEWSYWDHIHTWDQPQNIVFLKKVRRLIETYQGNNDRTHSRVLMLEASVPNESVKDYYGTKEEPGGHFAFNFNLISVTKADSARNVRDLINGWYDSLPRDFPAWANFLLGNHDQKRAATRWTSEGVDAANMINLLLKGTSVTYYGEEIGMVDSFYTWEDTVDPQACNTDADRYISFSRDPARAPMQWNNATSAGFSTNPKTWLPVHPHYKKLNVAAQKRALESHWKVYAGLLKLRKSPAWKFGHYECHSLSDNRVLGFTRVTPNRSGHDDVYAFLVLANISDEPAAVDATSAFDDLPGSGFGTLLLQSVGQRRQSNMEIGDKIDLSAVVLGPRKGVVIQLSP